MAVGSRYRAASIRTYLKALAIVTALPLVGLQISSSLEYYRLSLAHGSLRVQGTAQATATAALQLLSMAEDMLEGSARHMGLRLADPVQCPELLSTLKSSTPYLVNLLVADQDGVVLCSANPLPAGETLDVGYRDWFTSVRSTHDFSVGAPVVGRITQGWVVALAVPILGPGGEFRGALASSVALAEFQNLLAGTSFGSEALLTIADRNRVVLARSEDPNRWVGTVLPAEVEPDSPVSPTVTLAGGADINGVTRTWAKVQLTSVGWTVYAGVPTEQIRGPALAGLRGKVAWSISLLLLATALAWIGAKHISESHRRLVDSTRAAAQGTEVNLGGMAPAELVELASQFNESLAARSRAEASERTAKERYRSVLDNAVFGIYVSTEDGRFLEVNPALASMLGYDDTDELLAVGLLGHYRDPGFRDELLRRNSDREVIQETEVEWIRRDGSPVTVRLNGRRISLEDHDEAAFEVIVEDITGQRILEEELRHTQKMEAVGRLAGGVAHDFNNLLTVIGGNSQVLMEELSPSDPRRVELAEISAAVDHAETLTRQLLTFSRKERTQPQLVDPNQLVAGLEKMLGRLIGEDVHLHTRLETSVPPVLVDPGHLEQVLMNLAVNARDAMPDGGALTLETTSSPRGPNDPLATGPESQWVIISVADTGVGISPSTRERIFEPFFTTKAKGEGTGLGLATVYAIVDQAGGQVHVSSHPGKGSRFDVWLPAAERTSARRVHRARDEASAAPGVGTILVAEDEAPVRRIVQRVLEETGYNVLLAADGAEAAELAADYDGDIDLVITDVVMPNMKGTELADCLDVSRPGTPVLFMSGYVDNAPLQSRIGDDHSLFMPKPFTPSQLRARVGAILAPHRDTRNAPAAQPDLAGRH